MKILFSLIFIIAAVNGQAAYYAYIRDFENNPIRLNTSDTNLNQIINASLPTYFFVHGYNQNYITQWVKLSIDSLMLNQGTAFQYNVIAVDWPGVEGRVTDTGTDMGIFYDILVNNFQFDKMDFHCIGEGLGAHVCGFSGKHSYPSTIGRITGLDPARNNFNDPNSRLNSTDALFVDVIHTDIDASITPGYGIIEPIGHLDFYPNGGERHPNCDLQVGDACPHRMAAELFSASIRYKIGGGYFSQICSTYNDYTNGLCNLNPSAYMGFYLDIGSTAGVYYTTTSGLFPH